MRNLTKSNNLLKVNKRLIPGGTTLNKTTFFDEGLTPFSLVRGKGANVWDVDGNIYTDYMLGLGCVTLGYCHNEVDKAITDQLKNGISFSLSHPLELEVAQKLVEMIPCAEMVRFGKNGSDVLSAAVKLARHITRRDHVLFCGYHGWHDWCVARSSRPGGIPEPIRQLSHKFVYNDIDSLRNLIKELDGQISCVVMDVVARYYPKPGFLEAVRELTSKHGILLIYDEIVTGFRIHRGGAQAFFNVIPDLACFGKALANGMPVSVLVGKGKYMSKLDEVYFSLTYAGETLTLAAANAVIDIYKAKDIPMVLHQKGVIVREELEKRLKNSNLDNLLEIQGMPSRLIVGFKANLEADLLKKKDELSSSFTRIMIQEMAKKGILFNSSIFMSYSHSEDDLKYFIKSFDEVCLLLAEELEKKKGKI